MANVPHHDFSLGRSLHRGPLPGRGRSPGFRPAVQAAGRAGGFRPPGGLGTASAPGPVAPQDAAGDPYDYTDPILQKIQAISTQARQDALASALSARKQLAIAYGDTAGVLEGDQFDQSTADAARNNPFSILAELQRGHERGAHQIDENTNTQNLFYSGERGRQLGLEAENTQRARAQAAGNLQGHVGDIQSGLAAALMNADRQDAQAQAEAEARAQQRASTYGYDPGAAAAGSGGLSAPGGFSATPVSPLVRTLAPPRPRTLTPTDPRRLARQGSYGY
jgi:hypothetical protein